MIEADEVLPRLWIGTCGSCDEARGQGIHCVNVLEAPHVGEGCVHVRILGDDGKASVEDLTKMAMEINRLWLSKPGLLIHCGGGADRSPLATAFWMRIRFSMDWDEAYAWLKRHRAQINDRRDWIRS